ncbi:hypothetical protein DNTS_027786 [Danionella cerebrum]|uniref:Uncharacterized protein n=1 Tax=Danionella cerebrum TaxID=2873325 RepID=A0A553Q4G7_9TELE|nr:hypothetical protein DNTS_027786 [Danionella translucida]
MCNTSHVQDDKEFIQSNYLELFCVTAANVHLLQKALCAASYLWCLLKASSTLTGLLLNMG